MKKFETIPGASAEINEKESYFEQVKEVDAFLETIAGEMRKENIPVRDDGRIDMEAFADIYPDMQNDKEEVERLQEIFREKIPPRDWQEKQRASKGEQLEMLTVITLFKKLRRHFIVVRASLYDDYKNKADTILIDRDTNTPLCTLDEVSAIGGPKFEKKKQFTMRQNGRQNGAHIKYGLAANKDGTISKTQMQHIPSFYFPLPPERLEAGIREIELSLDTESQFEKDFFEYFKTTIAAQTAGILFAYPDMSTPMRERLLKIQEILGKMGNETPKKN